VNLLGTVIQCQDLVDKTNQTLQKTNYYSNLMKPDLEDLQMVNHSDLIQEILQDQKVVGNQEQFRQSIPI
jgi:hypothetical protein